MFSTIILVIGDEVELLTDNERRYKRTVCAAQSWF